MHSFQIPNCAPDTWKRKAGCRFIIVIIIVKISIGFISQSSKGECYRKRLLSNIAFGLSSRKVRVGQGENEGNLVTHSLSAKKYVTCDMWHVSWECKKYFATCFHLLESHKLSKIRIIWGQTGSMRREGGEGGGWEYRGCLGAVVTACEAKESIVALCAFGQSVPALPSVSFFSLPISIFLLYNF